MNTSSLTSASVDIRRKLKILPAVPGVASLRSSDTMDFRRHGGVWDDHWLTRSLNTGLLEQDYDEVREFRH